jgi:hypothetical protein
MEQGFEDESRGRSVWYPYHFVGFSRVIRKDTCKNNLVVRYRGVEGNENYQF